MAEMFVMKKVFSSTAKALGMKTICSSSTHWLFLYRSVTIATVNAQRCQDYFS